MKPVLLIATLAAAIPAQAQVYKCVEGGKTAYSQVPCSPDAKIINAQPATGAADPVSADRLRLETARINDEFHRRDAVKAGDVYVGMKAKDVRDSWGDPTVINRSAGAGGVHEQWVYRRSPGVTQYVYVDNGVVSSWQSPVDPKNR